MTDPLSEAERSARMAKVRSAGNQSTEGYVEAVFVKEGITGWEKHPKHILGKPDFFFPEYRLAVFIDGCFWHACPVCKRRIPEARGDFWRAKIEKNRRRDNRVRRDLWREGYHVIRIWEHDLKKGPWLKRLLALMKRIDKKRIPQ